MTRDRREDELARELMRSTAREFLQAKVPIDWSGAVADSSQPQLDELLWQDLVEMGWVGINLPESVGGSGLEFTDQAFLFEEMGRCLYPGPYMSNVILAAPCLSDDESALASLASGEETFTLAWAEVSGAVSFSDVSRAECQAVQTAGNWFITGSKIDVPDAGIVSKAVVVARSQAGVGLFLVDLKVPEVAVGLGLQVDGSRRNHHLELMATPATLLAGPEETLVILTEVRRRALCASAFEALGIAERVLEDTVAFASTREQFGKPIGAFQAVSGPIADCFVSIQLARALADWALLAIARDDPGVDVAVAAAKAAATDAATQTVERAIQVTGAIGFTWEFPLHRYLRRALWLDAFEGNSTAQRSFVAAALLDDHRSIETVELLDDGDASAFRAGVRHWIDEHLPTPQRGLDLIGSLGTFEETKERWRVIMRESGNLVAHWPEEFGGQGSSDVLTAIFREEAIKAHPRVSHGDCGVDLVAPLLMRYGTRDQQARFMDPIRTEAEIWTQGFSEPDAGSDLASLRTRAVHDGDIWVMNGNKTWSTYAPDADWIFVLARTDPDAARHRGISCFLVDARSTGVDIRPIRDIAGSEEFGEVFFTDVRVPEGNLLGGVNEGWSVAVMTLAHERVIESYEDIGELGFAFDRLLDGLGSATGAGQRQSSLVRDQVARLWCQLQAVRLVQYRCVLALQESDAPPSESEIVKLVWSEVAQGVASLGVKLFATSSSGQRQNNDLAAFWVWNHLIARSLTIYAGTSEIIRSIVAERVLGLPRSR